MYLYKFTYVSNFATTIMVNTLCVMVCSWIYRSSDELDGSSHWGQVSLYGGGGFVQDLAPSMEESLAQLKPLFDNLWLDRATRAVFVDFTVYNANINLFCVIKYVTYSLVNRRPVGRIKDLNFFDKVLL